MPVSFLKSQNKSHTCLLLSDIGYAGALVLGGCIRDLFFFSPVLIQTSSFSPCAPPSLIATTLREAAHLPYLRKAP